MRDNMFESRWKVRLLACPEHTRSVATELKGVLLLKNELEQQGTERRDTDKQSSHLHGSLRLIILHAVRSLLH